MATYKMIYVDARGRGEILRLLFAYKGVEFEDVRIPQTEVPEARKDSPFGILPVLHTEGKILSGNGTIARYLGEKFDLASDNPLNNAELYSIVDALELLWNKFAEVFFETDPKIKEEKKINLVTAVIPVYFGKLELMASKSTSSEGWIHGGKLTYADFAMFAIMDTIAQHASEAILLKFPSMKKIYDNFQKIDSVAKYLSLRPSSQ